MKTNYFKLLTTITILLLVQSFVNAQNNGGQRTMNKNLSVPADVTIQMKNYSGDLKIFTAEDNSVSIKTTVEINANSKEDVDKVLDAIDNFEFSLHGNVLEIDTRFYKSMTSTNNRTTMTLLNGEKVNIKDFKVRHELQIPKSASLDLDNKYSDIDLQSINGKARFVIYSSKLNAENFGKDVSIESKYSKIKLGNINGETDFDFYDTDIEMGICKNMNIKSKYSKFEIEKAGDIEIDSYDDKFTVDVMTSLDFKSKYSDFVSQAAVNEINLELYDCNIQIKSAVKGSFVGKYCELKLGDIKELNVEESYDNDFYLGKTENIQILESKYSKYEIDEVSSFKISGYNDDVTIHKLTSGFSEIKMDGKYGKLNIDAGNESFRVAFKIKYPSIHLPESLKISNKIKDNNDLELVAGEKGGVIKVEGYDMKVVIND